MSIPWTATEKARKPKSPPSMPKPPSWRMKSSWRWSRKGKDDLMEEFFEKGTLPEEHIITGLDEEMREMRVFPVLCMSGLHNIGSDMLLESDRRGLPSPLDRPAVKLTLNGAESRAQVLPIPNRPPRSFSRLRPIRLRAGSPISRCSRAASKTMRICMNATRSADERLAHIGVPLGKTICPSPNCTRGTSARSRN